MPRADSIKRKICLVLPSLQAGGMERVMAQLANYFATVQGLQVHLILFGSKKDLFYKLDSNILISRFNSKTSNRKLLFLKTIKFIRSKVREIDPDAVLSFGTHWNNLVLLALLGSGYRIFVSDRGAPNRKYIFPHMHLRKILYRYSSGIIAQTEIARRISTELFPKVPVQVIGNPISVDINGVKVNSIEKVILTVGRLIDTKHHDRLIEIFAKLNNNNGWKLIIVGGNALKQKNSEQLASLIQDKEMTNQISLVGSQKDVKSYYTKGDIFAFTSSVEGFPNVVGEALSFGLPVVSYDCIAGPSEMIIDGENGFLVPVFDDELFRQRLQMLIDDDALRVEMGKKARESMEKFSVDVIGQQYLNFILS